MINKKHSKAFTIIELIVVMAVIGILVLLAVPKFVGHTKQAKFTKLVATTKQLENASERYYMDSQVWPRVSDEPYTDEQIKIFAEKVYDATGKIVVLDPEGKYYDINYEKLSQYVSLPDNKAYYIIQNPVGNVYALEGLSKEAETRITDINATGLALNSTTLTISTESTVKLFATFQPVNTSTKILKWTSSNETIATVDNTGNVTGISEGTAIITATNWDGRLTATSEVTVISPFYGNGALGDLVVTSNVSQSNTSAIVSNISVNLVTLGTKTVGTLGGEFQVGDEVMLHASKGTTVTTTGYYDFYTVKSINGNVLEFNKTVDGTKFLSNNTQILKVPNYNNLTINNGITVSPMPYNGSYGGIIIFRVKSQFMLNGKIVSSNSGYRTIDVSSSPLNGINGSSWSTPANNGYGGSGGGGGTNQFSGGRGGNSSFIGGIGGSGRVGMGSSLDLTKKIYFGGAGGNSGNFNWGSGYDYSIGGTGGGIVMIFAKSTDFLTTGEISANGQSNQNASYSGSGSGAGGSILINTNAISNIKNYTLGAVGAGGGAQGTSTYSTTPSNNGNNNGGSGYWNAWLSSGGIGVNGNGGGGGSQSAGYGNQNGGNATTTYAGNASDTSQWAGGGGGGAGYISVYTKSNISVTTLPTMSVKIN